MTKREALVNIEMTAKDMIFWEIRIDNERGAMFDDEESDSVVDKFIEGYQEKISKDLEFLKWCIREYESLQ